MNSSARCITVRIVVLWVSLCSIGLPAEARKGWIDEIKSDLAEQEQESFAIGVSPIAASLHMLARVVLGMPDDLSRRVTYGLSMRYVGARALHQVRYAATMIQEPRFMTARVWLSIAIIFAAIAFYGTFLPPSIRFPGLDIGPVQLSAYSTRPHALILVIGWLLGRLPEVRESETK
jgi:hypothetical protein